MLLQLFGRHRSRMVEVLVRIALDKARCVPIHFEPLSYWIL